MAEALVLGEMMDLRAGVGDGDKAAAHLVGADNLPGAFPEVLLEDVWFEGSTRFTRNDEERVGEVELLFDRSYLGRIGGIEHEQLGKAVDLAEGKLHHFGTEA